MAGKKTLIYFGLVGVNFIYACESIFTKLASGQDFLSWKYLLFIACAIAVLGIYAIVWQQIIKRLPVSEAYMFKGTALIFVMLISALLFGEGITWFNVLGASLIVGGITLFARS